jgi:hypothetical protein
MSNCLFLHPLSAKRRDRQIKAQQFNNVIAQRVDGRVQLVGPSGLLEMFPEALNEIEFRAILRQPENADPVGKQTQGSAHWSTVMVGSVIHSKNDGLSRIGMHQQVFEKLNKGLIRIPLNQSSFVGARHASPCFQTTSVFKDSV